MKNVRTSNLFLIVQGAGLLKIFAVLAMFIVSVFLISALLTSIKPQFRPMSESVNEAAVNVNGGMLYQLMGWENHHFLKVENQFTSSPGLTHIMFKLSNNINLDDPRSLLGRELPGLYQFDGKIVAAGEGTNYTNMPIESAPPMEIMKAEREAALQNLDGLKKPQGESPPQAPGQTTGNRKVVYVYFSHNRESYLPYLKGVTDPDLAYHSKINVTKIGDQLKESFEERGIGTSVDKTDIQANLNKKGWKFWKSYEESGAVVQAAMATNHDLHYLIDIHRDAKRKKETTVTINGQSYAKLAFIIGGNNPNHERNERLAKELHNLLQKKYKGVSWGVMKKQGAGSNGVYNQNLSGNALLIEFGGVDNTFEELNRSAEALADVFSDYYWQAEKVNQNVDQTINKQ